MAKKLFFFTQIVFLVVGVAFLLFESSSRIEQVNSDLFLVPPGSLAAALGLTLAGLVFYFTTWSLSFHGSGSRKILKLPFIFFVGQIGKYIPGPMLGTAGHGLLSKSDFHARTGIFASLKATGFVVLTGATLGSIALIPILGTPLFTYALIIGNIFAISSLPDKIIWWALRSKELVTEVRVSLASRFFGLISAYGMWFFFGLGVFALATSLDTPTGGFSVFEVILGYAASHTTGILVIIAPAGIGVRELVFESLLSEEFGELAFLLAAAARVVHVVSDAIMAGLAAILLILGKRWRDKGNQDHEG